MQLKQIETFYWAARLGSFTRAARHAHMTTSTVSMRIQELEGRLGVLLFDRSRRRVQLCPARRRRGCCARLAADSDERTGDPLPDMQAVIEVALSHVLEDKLDAGMLDMALAPCQLAPSRFAHTSLGGENFRWMCDPALMEVPESTPKVGFVA
jgi:DNA-binding transcriptional LysR family regulator